MPENSSTLCYIVLMERAFFAIGAFLGFAAVAAGAFGAHGLRGRLSPEMVEVFELAVRYQMYHALALLATACWAGRFPTLPVNLAGWLLVAGTIIFSGSLYLLSLSGERWWGAITPLGGLALLAGWASLAWAAWGKGSGF